MPQRLFSSSIFIFLLSFFWLYIIKFYQAVKRDYLKNAYRQLSTTTTCEVLRSPQWGSIDKVSEIVFVVMDYTQKPTMGFY